MSYTIHEMRCQQVSISQPNSQATKIHSIRRIRYDDDAGFEYCFVEEMPNAWHVLSLETVQVFISNAQLEHNTIDVYRLLFPNCYRRYPDETIVM